MNYALLVEAAVAIAGRARRFNFSSDASHRFERGVDFNNCVDGIERATRLILEICGGEPGPTEDRKVKLPAREPVRMRAALIALRNYRWGRVWKSSWWLSCTEESHPVGWPGAQALADAGLQRRLNHCATSST